MRRTQFLSQDGRLYLAVGCGAAAGSLVRYLVGIAVHTGGVPPFFATTIVNVAGSFIIALFAAMTGPDGRIMVRPIWRQFVMAGFCGGLTTFSSMSLDTLLLAAGRHPFGAGLYLACVILLSLLAALAGHLLATRLNQVPSS